MQLLKNILKVGTVIGDGARSFTVEKTVSEVIALRRHPNGGRGEPVQTNGVLRIIPTIIVEDILKGLRNNSIQLTDIIRKNREEQNLPGIFSTLGLDHDSFIMGYDSTIFKICEYILSHENDTVLDSIPSNSSVNSIPKPFLLLAGISGTGKTRFVREQAAKHAVYPKNHCLIAVRPDWHEPSDLLGYVSRMGASHYVVTDLLCFVVAAWKEAVASATAEGIQNKAPADMTSYWLCLDEMNLAPVEQYFADYLAVLETRSWNGDVYSCDPLLKADAFNKLPDSATKMREDLELVGSEYDGLWAYFMKAGIPLPPNLIVAGTVNMDETTHGFSRKVIDRAFTIDFGAFYPNDFGHYFVPQTKAKTLGFPCLSAVSKENLTKLTIDPEGQKSIAFLNAINDVLKNTPFELAFRALNELLISLVCFNPKNDAELQAVWDDFLMTKVLPRIDGDSHKLGETDESSLLRKLASVTAAQCSDIWDTTRIDLLRESTGEKSLEVPCRSKAKLAWMQERLVNNGFTSFWP